MHPILPPRPLLLHYLFGCLLLMPVYMLAVETDGDWSRGFNLLSALRGSAQNIGPALLLLPLAWPFTGWMERQGFSVWRQMLNHFGMALLFAVLVHWVIWLVIWLRVDTAAAERARANWFLWQTMWMMMMYWAAAGAFSAYRAVQRARAEGQAAEQARSLLARSELAALRNKLNPHFLFNTLHSILALVRRDARQAEHALLTFSDMLRYLLDAERNSRELVPLRDEMAFTAQYLELEGIRLGSRLQLDWDVDEDALDRRVPMLSVQPLVENSIKHAFNPTSKPGRLRVQVRCEGETVHVEIADDGPGCRLPADGSLPPGQGLGLPTVARRLQLAFGRDVLRLRSAPGEGFAVHLHFPA